jgi:hypothetical protein
MMIHVVNIVSSISFCIIVLSNWKVFRAFLADHLLVNCKIDNKKIKYTDKKENVRSKFMKTNLTLTTKLKYGVTIRQPQGHKMPKNNKNI